jgi:hypothetical protein
LDARPAKIALENLSGDKLQTAWEEWAKEEELRRFDRLTAMMTADC